MRRSTIAIVFALLGGISPPAQTAQYTVTDLGTLGSYYSQAFGVSESGSVCGESYTGDYTACHTFVWTDGIMTDLGAPVNNAMGWDVNDSLEVAGWGYDGSGNGRPLLWAGGTLTDLGTLGGPRGYAYAINNAGQIAGYSANPGGMSRASLWYAGTITDLGTLGGNGAGAYGINESGQVVGYSDTASGQTHATLWSGGSVYDLGVLEYWSYAWDINNVGQAVGYSSSGAYYRAFFWEGGVISALGPADTYSTASGINDSGQVAGMVMGPTGWYAALWEDGALYDLNSLITPGSGWTLVQANDINNRGQIVGYGQVGGENHAFLLTPTNTVPAPGAFLLAIFGAATAAAVRRVRQR